MSDQNDQLDDVVDTPTNETTETTTTESTAPEAKADAKVDAANYDYVPAKFLKEDGTPDFEKLAKSYTGLEKKLGSRPNIPASSVDDYEFDFGDEFQIDDERMNGFKTAALEKGFTKDQYSFLMEQYKNVLGESTWTADKAETALKQAWGNDFDTQTASAGRAFEEFAPSGASPNDPVWNHPAVMQLLARIGSELGEDSLTGKAGSGASAPLDRSEIDAMMTSKDYWSNPEKQAKVAQWYQKNVK